MIGMNINYLVIVFNFECCSIYCTNNFSNLRRNGVVELVGEAVGMEEGDSAARGGPTEVFLPRHLQGQAVR